VAMGICHPEEPSDEGAAVVANTTTLVARAATADPSPAGRSRDDNFLKAFAFASIPQSAV